MSNLYWLYEGDKYVLTNNADTLIELIINQAGQSFITINTKQYTIVRKGFWNIYYSITEFNEEAVRIVHSFWGSNGKIIFTDGSIYSSKYKFKEGLLYVRFMDGANEILSYKTDRINRKQLIQFNIGTSIVDAEKLLLLSAIGKFLFITLFNNGNITDDEMTSFLLTSI